MNLYVLDTDTLVLYEDDHDKVRRRVMLCACDELATTAITVEEQLSGWYTRRSFVVPCGALFGKLCVKIFGAARLLRLSENIVNRRPGLLGSLRVDNQFRRTFSIGEGGGGHKNPVRKRAVNNNAAG
jgi:hypothetical protein